MTTLSILNGDFEILFEDEVVGTATTGMRMIRRAAGASATVYTTLQLYSAVADAADEFQAMGFRNPMLPVTPNAFTLENKYFMPRSSTEWLKEGTISADWNYTATPDSIGNGVVAVAWSGGTGPVAGDIGRLITQGDSGDTGTLLDFETDIDGTTYVWIRPDDSTPVTGDLFDGTGTLIVTGGTMSATTSTAGLIGNTRYTAIQAIGSVPFATEVYVYQNRTKLTDTTGGFQWWTTDPNVSLGIISVLIRTHFQGTGFTTAGAISDSDIEVFARRYTSLYDNFRLNVAAGGFSALPLASSPDINNTTGYQTMTGSGGSGTFQVGELATESTSGAQVVLTAVGGTVAAPILEYYIVGDLTNIAGGNTLTGATSGATCTSAAPTTNLGGPTDTASGEGGTVTITIGTTTADFDGNGTAEPYSITVDAQTNVPVAKVYERLKYVTRRGQDNTFWTTVGTSVPGEAYRGIEALYYYDNPVGTFTQGDDITGQGGYTARVFAVNSAASGEGVSQAYITVTDQQTSLDTVANNDTLSDEGADTVDADNAGAGGAFLSIASPKASPFGTFTGTTIFGAQGVLFTNIDNDPQAYTLTDDLGTLRPPPNTVTILVDNTLALDRVLVARDTGTSGIIDKDQFGGMTATAQSATSITVGGTVDPEVPAAGWVRVVAVDELQEHRYKYDSRTTGASGVFTLTTPTSSPGSATSASTTQLIDSTAAFTTDGTEVGMLVRNTFAGKTTHVWEVTNIVNATTLDVRALYGPLDATQDWDIGDTWEMNETIQAYDTNDNIFDLIIDAEATTTSYSNTIVKTPAANFGVVVNVRQGKVILPFTQNATVGDSGLTVTTVRQDDTIAV